MSEIELNKEELLYWLSWLRKQAKEANIWSGANDEIAYSQIVALIKSGQVIIPESNKIDGRLG